MIYDTLIKMKTKDIRSDFIDQFEYKVDGLSKCIFCIEGNIHNIDCNITMNVFNWGSKISFHLESMVVRENINTLIGEQGENKHVFELKYNMESYLRSTSQMYWHLLVIATL